MSTEPQLQVELQVHSDSDGIPPDASFRRWAELALCNDWQPHELVIRVVDEAEGRELNKRYRGKDRPTNVLSFPFEAPAGLPCDTLGDLVVCAPVVAQEAAEQGKTNEAHWAHMVIHGVLHLRGYDHQDQHAAQVMESLERRLLAQLGIADPYMEEETVNSGSQGVA